MISARHALGWVLATTLVTLAAWWVVAAASGEVNETAGAPLVVPTTSSSVDTGSSSLPDAPTSTAPGSTVTSHTTTSTTASGASTSTTAVAMPSGVETIGSVGGTVTVSYGNGQVSLQGASPAFGYSMEIEKTGPDEVRVDFESEDSDVSVRVKWEGASLDIEVKD
jgi:hypothetical protein